jgi:RNA polymerase sigma-70 factor (ECF subfamily)
MPDSQKDWAAIADRLAEGDQVAFVEVSQFVTAILRRRRAYDFRDDWSDVIQEVAWAVIKATREGRLRDRHAASGFIRRITANKFADCLRGRQRRREETTLPWEEAVQRHERHSYQSAPNHWLAIDLERALEKLTENERTVVVHVYGAGMTYQQVVDETGIPLGSVKRYLRDSLVELRRLFSGEVGST